MNDQSRTLSVRPLESEAFALFGQVIEAVGEPTVWINEGRCERFTDLAGLDFIDGGHAGISVFRSTAYPWPITIGLMERHPLGSQAFLPMSVEPFVVVVAPDDQGAPGRPQAFVTRPGQGVNYARNVWHAVLTPLHHPALFAVIDRIGSGNNLQEHRFETPYVLVNAG